MRTVSAADDQRDQRRSARFAVDRLRAARPLSVTCGCFAPILALPGQSEPSRNLFVPIARLLPHGDRRAAPDKVASSRISSDLIRNGPVALARRWGDSRWKSLRISHV